MLLSVLTPTRGTIEYFGKEFAKHREEILEKVSFAKQLCTTYQDSSKYEKTSIFMLNSMVSLLHERAYKIERFLKFFGMWNMADKETGVLSAGQMTRVMLAKAFISSPRIILLDEPTASLDPDIAHEVRSFYSRTAERRWSFSPCHLP